MAVSQRAQVFQLLLIIMTVMNGQVAENVRSSRSTGDLDMWVGDPEAISSVRRARKSLNKHRVDQVVILVFTSW